MPGVPLPDAQRLDAAPFDSGTTLYRLDLTTSDASIDLPAGGYVLVLDESDGASAIVRIDGVASTPASGASLASAFLVPAGSSATMRLTAAATVHAIMRADTGVLFFQRVL